MIRRIAKIALSMATTGALAVSFTGPAAAHDEIAPPPIAHSSGIGGYEIQDPSEQVTEGKNEQRVEESEEAPASLSQTGNSPANIDIAMAVGVGLTAVTLGTSKLTGRDAGSYSPCTVAATATIFTAGAGVLAGIVSLAKSAGWDVVSFASYYITLATAQKIVDYIPEGWHMVASLVEAHICG